MATNFYVNQAVRSEQNLYEDIVLESIKMYGQDVYYLPRDIVNENKVFGEDVPSSFNSSYKVEMYVENVDGFDGEGDLFTKFGVEIRDAVTLVVSRKRWSQTVQRFDNEITGQRPREGDLIYVPFTKKLFEIMHVEHEQPFYQLTNLPTYKLRCELFEFSSETLDTGIEEIDDIARDYAYTYILSLATPRSATITADVTAQEVISALNITDSGDGYALRPTVSIGLPDLDSSDAVLSTNVTDGVITSLNIDSSGRFYDSYQSPAITVPLPTQYTPEQALATITLGGDNIIKSINVINNGAGYIDSNGSAPTITIQDKLAIDPGTTAPTATAVVENGKITGITITDSGDYEYSFIPSVTISEPNAVIEDLRARARVTSIINGEIVATNVTAGGAFYDSPGAINISIASPTGAKSDFRATAEIFLDSDTAKVESITLTHGGNFYNNPTIVVDSADMINSLKVFEVGETVTQTLANGTVIRGTVSKYSDSDFKLHIINIGADDGKYHDFITGRSIIGSKSGSALRILSITEENKLSENEDNTSFTDLIDDFLDFSESNPFGDPENN